MIKVKIEGMAALRANLAGMNKQVRFAASLALNETAKAIEKEEQSGIAGAFDRPKGQTVKATYVVRSDKNNLEATIGIKPRARGVPAAEYLSPNIGVSGKRARAYKRSEFMLRQAGILPAGMFTVPGKEAKLDQYGNMSRGQIVSILSFFRTFGASSLNTKRMNMTKEGREKAAAKKRQYFIVPIGDRKLKLFPGIWQETAQRTLAPILMFVSQPVYNAIYDFEGIARKVVRSRFRLEFDKALEYALRTAR